MDYILYGIEQGVHVPMPHGHQSRFKTVGEAVAHAEELRGAQAAKGEALSAFAVVFETTGETLQVVADITPGPVVFVPDPAQREKKIRDMAREKFGMSDDCDVDRDAVVSEGDDNGAFVAAWVWVDFQNTPLCKGQDGDHTNCDDGCPVFDKASQEAP